MIIKKFGANRRRKDNADNDNQPYSYVVMLIYFLDFRSVDVDV